jgi:hypothetical protein
MKNEILNRIKALEDRVTYLENKPAEYVAPPNYGPLPRNNNRLPEITLSKEQQASVSDALYALGIELK